MPLPRADVKVGFACNNRCVFCAQGQKRVACGSIPLEALVQRLVEVRRGTSGLVLTGGEPLAYKHIVALVQAASRLGFHPIQIQTNGRLLSYRHVFEKVVAAGATEFSPSLHGSTAEVHDALTRAPGSWEQSLGGIRTPVAAGATVVTNSVVVKANVHDVPALTKLLAKTGVKQAQMAYVHPVGTALELFDEVVPRLPDVVPALAEAREIARRHGMRLVAEAMPRCFLRGMQDLCVEDAIPRTTVVDLEGQVADYSAWRTAEGKSHGGPCESCALRAACEGPWREYPDAYGWGEFVPFDAAEAAASGM